MSLYFIIFLIFNAANAKEGYELADMLIDVAYSMDFHIYNRANPSTPDILMYNDKDALNKSTYKPRDGTIVYIPDWMESVKDERAQGILHAYLHSMDYNIILVNWRAVSWSPDHVFTHVDAAKTGHQIANMMKWLEKHNRLNISDLHIIGMSFGAHIAGLISYELYPRLPRRITGLDPAKEGFEGIDEDLRLDKTDAAFVDIIHTSIKYAGISEPCGHADFYPNYGANQPGCWPMDIECSHYRAASYFIDSISNPDKYPGKECTFNDSNLEDCDDYVTAHMGHYSDSRVYGVFVVLNSLESQLPDSFTIFEE